MTEGAGQLTGLYPRGTDARRENFTYVSRFTNWDARASVRTKPCHRIGDRTGGSVYFPPELAPESDHPLVRALADEAVERLLVRRLYQYLDFTAELEAVTVIPVAVGISRSRSGLSLPSQMRADAFKIVTDEAWHAQFSDDLLRQLEKATGIVRVEAVPGFVARLSAISDEMEPTLRPTTGLLFAICSETLISAILATMPNDRRLPPIVREQVRDHAEDEGRHHAYFRDVLTWFWPALPAEGRRVLGPLLPRIIQALLLPDFPQIRNALIEIGLSKAHADQVLAESYPPRYLAQLFAPAARPTVRYLSDVGAFADASTRDSFERSGLGRLLDS